MNRLANQETVVLFDGQCNLCHGAVQFIIPRNHRDQKIHFASLQSQIGAHLLKQCDYTEQEIDSIVLIENGHAYVKSTAALRIARQLHGAWPAFYIFILIPTSIRDSIYDWIARNRYKWFGKTDSCLLSKPEWKSRFLE